MNNVTVDFVVEINKELSFGYAVISSWYLFILSSRCGILTPVYLGCVCLRGELGFLNCDDICMCVVNKQFQLLKFVLIPFYVDLQYDEISIVYCCLCCMHDAERV